MNFVDVLKVLLADEKEVARIQCVNLRASRLTTANGKGKTVEDGRHTRVTISPFVLGDPIHTVLHERVMVGMVFDRATLRKLMESAEPTNATPEEGHTDVG